LDPKGGLVITIDRTGSIFIDRDEITFDDFSASIKAIAERRGRDGVYLRGDKDVPYGQVVRVMAAMRAAGVEDVGLVAEPEDARR
jgi:biopolymer transport protein ExbD